LEHTNRFGVVVRSAPPNSALGIEEIIYMKPQEIEKWKKVRDKGLVRFIAVTGIFSFGVPMFVVLNFMNPPTKPLTVIDYIVLFLICAVAGGILFGYLVWVIQEKRYKKATEGAGTD
jgi:hypothetical protein